jgi:hypothetical protein
MEIESVLYKLQNMEIDYDVLQPRKECYALKKMRSIIGVLLILLSIAGLFFWEWKGRDAILTEQVLVAKEEISKGTVLNGSMFEVKGIPKANLLPDALAHADLGLIQDKVASQLIAKNDQVIPDYFSDNEFGLKRNESVFVIRPEWIAMRSSALRRGDIVYFYGTNGLGLLGTFRIAYVKDEAEREVKNAGDGPGSDMGASSEGDSSGGILDRTDSTSVIDHIEIITTYQEYERLAGSVCGADGATPAALIIVQKGEAD